MTSQLGRSAELSARDFNRRVADPELFSGGGSVAALVAASAAALSALVARLALKRRANSERQAELAATLTSLELATEAFYRAADTDLVVLDTLLGAQRALKMGGARADYVAALREAARSPLELAERCVELMQIIEGLLPRASRFTVSDLGAAAALAAGAARAALLTVAVNLALLGDEPCIDDTLIEPLLQRADAARRQGNVVEATIAASTSAAIAGNRQA